VRPFAPALRRAPVLLLAGLLLSTAACGKKSEPPAPSQRRPVPAFTLKDLSGKTVSLSQFKGKAVFLEFWATWCGPCRVSMPSVEKVHDEYAARGLQVLGMNVDEDASAVPAFAREMGISYPVLLVGHSGVDADYGVTGIPAFLLIDKQGRAVASWVGYESDFDGSWRRSIDKVLAEE
jgi:thiol-disulfide isomerase/thioredoxin